MKTESDPVFILSNFFKENDPGTEKGKWPRISKLNWKTNICTDKNNQSTRIYRIIFNSFFKFAGFKQPITELSYLIENLFFYG